MIVYFSLNRLFYQKSKLRSGFDLWINSLKWYKSRSLQNYIKTKVLTTCSSLKLSFFKKNKKGLVSLPYFLSDFLRKLFLTLYITNGSRTIGPRKITPPQP